MPLQNYGGNFQNTSAGALTDAIIAKLGNIEKRLTELELATNGHVIVNVTSDPSNLTNGMMWYNTTSNLFKIYLNGAIHTINYT